jgi:two-component system OmpR family sensor kinase
MTGNLNKVLLIEDNPGDALLLREALIDLGGALVLDLVHVGRLDDGLRRLRQEEFDAILLDLSLPDAHGLDTVARMQAAAPRLPIVVLTGLDDDAAALEAVRAGAQDYLVKGQIDGRLLIRALRYAIERKLTQEEIQQHLSRMATLKDINIALTSTLDLSAVLEVLLQKVATLMPEFAAAVRLWDEERLILSPVSCRNFNDAEWKAEAARPDFESDFTAEVFRSKTLVLVERARNNAQAEHAAFYRKHDVNAYLGIPMLVEEQVLGVVSFYARGDRSFSAQEVEFLSALASQASVAIRNSQVHGQMKQLVERLDRSNRIKEEFLGVISHELRTPLNVVKGYVQLLQTSFFGELSPEQDAAIEKIAGQTRDQLNMVDGILQAISIDSEVTSVRADPVPLRDFLDELQSTYFSLPDKPLSFRWSYSAALPLVTTDKIKLKYVLQNLINNAIKFTDEGYVTVSAAVLDSDPTRLPGQPLENARIWLKFDVADTGIGISKEFLPLIFEKFSQVDSSTTRVHGGIGLGLHIVKRCIELLHGTIEVDSELGKGSTFSVRIPCEINESEHHDGSSSRRSITESNDQTTGVPR